MSVRDIMAGNLVCSITGVDPQLASQALAQGSEQTDRLYKMVDDPLDGPCGTIELPCECQAYDGLEIAMDLIANAKTGDLTKEGEDAVREDRQFLLRLIQSKLEPQDPLTALFESMGFKVTKLL